MVYNPKFIMLVGVPGSGKSTWTLNFMSGMARLADSTEGWAVLSSDNYIADKAAEEGKTYDEVFDDYIKESFTQMNLDLKKAVADKKNIIWDQTNLSAKTRSGKLRNIPKHYEKIAIVFPTPADIDVRLKSRPGKTIPKHIVESMAKSFEMPTVEEGFDIVRTYNGYEKD